MELEGKRLLILGGSRITCEIVKHARDLGIITGVTDWYPIEKSPAKRLADEAYYVSTSDIDAMVQLIKEKKFDGIITGFTDSVLPYYAEICDRTGMPAYGTKKQFETFTDKQKYKKLLRKFDIPTMPEYKIDTERVVNTSVEFPVVVKPAEGSGSRGITICHNESELRAALRVAKGSSQVGETVVEKYIDAPEATIFWIFTDGRYHMSLLGNRHIKNNQKGALPLPVGYTYPSSVQPKFLHNIASKMERMFKYAGIRNGMMFMQCKIIDGECWVYDIGYRLTGTLEYINLKSVCGYDTMDMLIRFALTQRMCDSETEKKIDPYLGGKYAYNVSLLAKPGKIASISGLDEIREIPGVLDIVIAHPEGDEISESLRGRLAQITVRILGKSDSIDHMRTEMLKIQEVAHIISESGTEMILPGMEASDFEGTIYRKE